MTASQIRSHALSLNGGLNLELQPAQVAQALKAAQWEASHLKERMYALGNAKGALLEMAEAIEAKAPVATVATSAAPANSLDAIIRSLAVDGLRGEMSNLEARLRGELEMIAAAFTPRTVEISVSLGGGEARNIGRQHEIFPRVLRAVAANVPIWLVGPAGSGKTTLCRSVATALELPFYGLSVCSQTPESRLMGYCDAQGRYVASPIYTAFVSGGIVLIDEVDAGNANVLAALNAISDPGCSTWTFPDGVTVSRHDSFRMICAANTFGNGADRQYVGRNQLDAATLDRYAQISMDYDEDLERELAGNDDWTAEVQSLRGKVAQHGLRHIVSPRASIMGARLLAAGEAIADIRESLLYKGLDKDARIKLGAK